MKSCDPYRPVVKAAALSKPKKPSKDQQPQQQPVKPKKKTAKKDGNKQCVMYSGTRSVVTLTL